MGRQVPFKAREPDLRGRAPFSDTLRGAVNAGSGVCSVRSRTNWRPTMGKKLYVGNLSYDVSSSDLEQLFAAHGSVDSADVIMDRDTGRSKGFGFVEMSSNDEADAAISALDGNDFNGRSIKVNEARPRASSGGGGGRQGGGGGGGGRRDRW